MEEIVPELRELFRAAGDAARVLNVADTGTKNAALEAIAAAIEAQVERIVTANARDIAAGIEHGLTAGLLDRLELTPSRVLSLATAVREIVALPDPIGQVLRGSTLPNGLKLTQIRVPFGVVGAIYEARPNVTVDIAALALKSGNAVVLRGGSAAEHSNRVLVDILREAVQSAGLPANSISTVDPWGRDGARALMRGRGFIDVIIPRGSQSLINAVVSESLVPAIETGAGVVHVFIDESATPGSALPIVVNSKVQRPSVCNALDTLLVHRKASHQLRGIIDALQAEGVLVRGTSEVASLGAGVHPVTDEDWSTEQLGLSINVRLVDSIDEALQHIRQFSTKHTESILTENLANAERFLAEVDAAVVMVNSSTRFTDGGVFGFGAEVGISTQKLHARGPMGLPELTSTKWVLRGNGQVRP